MELIAEKIVIAVSKMRIKNSVHKKQFWIHFMVSIWKAIEIKNYFKLEYAWHV